MQRQATSLEQQQLLMQQMEAAKGSQGFGFLSYVWLVLEYAQCLYGLFIVIDVWNFLYYSLDTKIYEGLTPTKDGGTCLRRLSMFRKEVH